MQPDAICYDLRKVICRIFICFNFNKDVVCYKMFRIFVLRITELLILIF